MTILHRTIAIVGLATAALLAPISAASAAEVNSTSLVFTSTSHCPAGYHEIIVGAKYTGDLVYVCYN